MDNNSLDKVDSRSIDYVRSLWSRYQKAKVGWKIVVPLGLAGIAAGFLSWAWTMLDQNEYGAALLLTLCFLLIGIVAAIAIARRSLKVVASICVVVITGFSVLKILHERSDKPWTTIFKNARSAPVPAPQSVPSPVPFASLSPVPSATTAPSATSSPTVSPTPSNATGGVQQLNLLSLDRTFAGIELSYKPSAREWNSVVEIYRTIAPPAGESSYYDAPIIATRSGSHWRIDFEPVSLREGQKWFPPQSTEDEKNQAFERIIQTAALPLLITWSNGSETLLEPWRGDYPSALKLSQDRFVFTLRPPVLELTLANLYQDSSVTLRSRNPWCQERREVTVHSLDQALELDQRLLLNWKKEPMNKMQRSYPITLYPYASGPHRLNITFKTLSP